MSETVAFACLVASLVVFPLAVYRITLRGPRFTALALLLSAAGLAAYLSTIVTPVGLARLIHGSDLALLHPGWGGVLAVCVLVALRPLAPARDRVRLKLLAGLVAVYFASDALHLTRDPGRGLSERRVRNGVCLQTTAWSCAPAAAVTLLGRLGIATSEAEMARAMRSREDRGTSDLLSERGLEDALRDTPYTARLDDVSYEQLIASGGRALVPLRLGAFETHMVAVTRVEGARLTVCDPRAGVLEMGRAEFEAVWPGRAVLVVRR